MTILDGYVDNATFAGVRSPAEPVSRRVSLLFIGAGSLLGWIVIFALVGLA